MTYKIENWNISVTVRESDDIGKEDLVFPDVKITDIPNHVADVVDEWLDTLAPKPTEEEIAIALTELEEQKNNG